MWGAIIKAIDHQMDRNAKGMRSGIEVAGGQSHASAGGAGTTSSGSSENVPQNITEQSEAMNTDAADTTPIATASNEQADENSGTLGIAEKDDNEGDSSSLGDIGSLAGSEGGAEDAIASDERLKAKKCASITIKNWHNKDKMLSDGNAKTSKNASTFAAWADKASGKLSDAGAAAIAVSQGKGAENLGSKKEKKELSSLESEMADYAKEGKKSRAQAAQDSVTAK